MTVRPCGQDRLSSPTPIMTEQDSREFSAGANSVQITLRSTVSETHNTREFFLGPISTHVASSNQFHAHLVDTTKHNDISSAGTSDFVSNLHDHDHPVNFGVTERVSFEHAGICMTIL